MKSQRQVRKMMRVAGERRQARETRRLRDEIQLKMLWVSYLGGHLSANEYMDRYLSICGVHR